MTGYADIRVAVCICTFKRQELLRALLAGVAQLAFCKVQPRHLEIVVVDNDELASAREVCLAVSLPWQVKYVVEPRRGISHARNRAIAEAGSIDFLAFIDDDEVPTIHWLDELLWAQAEFAADVVSGPVLPAYSADVAEWVRRGGFFDGRVSTTGTTRRTCSTNNALVGSHVFRRVLRFDDAFTLSGAEDTHFFSRAVQAGFRIVWSQEASVYETVSAQRGSLTWILRRGYQTGNGWVFCEADLGNRLLVRVARFFKAWGHVASGGAKALWSLLLLDKVRAVKSLREFSLGAGMLAGLLGQRFLAYRKAGTAHIGRLERVATKGE